LSGTPPTCLAAGSNRFVLIAAGGTRVSRLDQGGGANLSAPPCKLVTILS
jgi:hypothetical protein